MAVYLGTNGLPYPASALMANAFIRAIESPMFFTANTIDQPGKQIALAAHGHWLGGDVSFDTADSWLLVGTNPVVSKAIGIPGQNPAQHLKAAVARGMKLIVVDPRRSQTAARAAIHIQPRPGEDVSILAAFINLIITEGLCDTEFLAENVDGFDTLAAAVSPFTPDYAAERADVPVEQIIDAARLFATHGTRGGMVNAGTGPNMGRDGSLLEYLCMCLTTVCGRWARAGEKVLRPNTLLPAFTAKAQAHAPYEGWGYGERLRVRGLTDTVAGMPTAALADEILLEGEGQVRALICVGGNPMAAWPDQRKTEQALESLELLVTLDTEMSGTSRMADYVIAPLMQMETPAMTAGSELIKYYTSGTGIPAPYAQYAPRLIDPPEGSDLTEEWQFFLGSGQADGPGTVVRQLLRKWRRQIHGISADRGGSSTVIPNSPPRNCSSRCARRRAFRSTRYAAIRTAKSSTLTRWSRSVTPTARRAWTSATKSMLSGLAEIHGRRLPGRAGRHRVPDAADPAQASELHELLGHHLVGAEPREAVQPGICASRHAGVVESEVGNRGDGGFAARPHPVRGGGRRHHAPRRHIHAPRLRRIPDQRRGTIATTAAMSAGSCRPTPNTTPSPVCPDRPTSRSGSSSAEFALAF